MYYNKLRRYRFYKFHLKQIKKCSPLLLPYKLNCFYLYVYLICLYLLTVCGGEGDTRSGEAVRWTGPSGVPPTEN